MILSHYQAGTGAVLISSRWRRARLQERLDEGERGVALLWVTGKNGPNQERRAVVINEVINVNGGRRWREQLQHAHRVEVIDRSLELRPHCR